MIRADHEAMGSRAAQGWQGIHEQRAVQKHDAPSSSSSSLSSDQAGRWVVVEAAAVAATSPAVSVVEGATKARVLAVATVGRKKGANGASCTQRGTRTSQQCR
jgi:hypothetical protein